MRNVLSDSSVFAHRAPCLDGSPLVGYVIVEGCWGASGETLAEAYDRLTGLQGLRRTAIYVGWSPTKPELVSLFDGDPTDILTELPDAELLECELTNDDF